MNRKRLGSAIQRVRRQPILVVLKFQVILSAIRRISLSIQAFLNGGILQLDPSVRIEHQTVFQGEGRLIAEESVIFGYWMAGASVQPILMQPREPGSVIRIGARSQIVNGCEFIARTAITVGHDCLIGARTVIMDSDFHGVDPNARQTPGLSLAVVVGNNVWVGNEAMILKGVSIGQDAVIGARCVVTKNVPQGAIVVGNPMRIAGSVYA